MPTPTLECQDCGDVIREMTPQEVEALIRNADAWVVWCRTCSKARGRAL